MRIFEGYQRGVNLGGWLSQCVALDDRHFDTFITEADIERIAGWGLDHVRLPIDCDIVFAGMDGAPGARMRHVDDCVDWCGRHGLRLILDLHKTYGYMFDTAVVADPDAFFSDPALQDAFIRLWQTLARRYGSLHDRVAFELLNEVTNPAQAENWNRIAARAMEAVRAIAPDTWILVGGVNNNSVTRVPLLEPPRDARVVYNFHCYEPLVFTHQKAGWVRGMTKDFTMSYPAPLAAYDQAAERLGLWQAEAQAPSGMIGPDYFEALFRDALDYAQRQGAPLYCGEYGVIDQADPGDTLRWYRDIHAVFERHGIGRAAWTYKVRDFGLTDPHYDGIREELIKAL
ncbi:MAG: cellulase family glycosylhydrolase [Clostridia bacterium]|nr:cellulase family glycosylhydrolase [Clostridia bacterium]